MNTHPESPVVLSFTGVSFAYGQVPVLDRISFHIHEGEFTALVGANGAGKTTILKLILGLETPKAGEIHLFGLSPKENRIRIGYVPQHAGYDPTFPISVAEVVLMGRLNSHTRKVSAEDLKAADTAMVQAEISELRDRPYPALSGGQRRRVLVARALAAHPNLLILDEPTANMDAESEKRLFSTLGNLKKSTTVLIVTHDTSFVSALTDVVLCVGDRNSDAGAASVVRHETEPLPNTPKELFGGNAVKVLHDTTLPDTCCFSKGTAHE